MDLATIAARYTKTVMEEDALGRAITVGKLKPSQKVKVAEFAVVPSTFSSLHAACSFRDINGIGYAFPRSREEADSRLDLLDQEGLVAVLAGMNKLYADDAQLTETETDQIKN